MGKNLYETPRDMNKWHTGHDAHTSKQSANTDDKKARLEALKNRYKKNKH